MRYNNGTIAPTKSSVIIDRLLSRVSAKIPPKGMRIKFGINRQTTSNDTYRLDKAFSGPSNCSNSSMEATYVSHLINNE
jgi:hypothetical protein